VEQKQMYELYIGNKNYSSWSLRPWVLMKELDIPFNEQLVPFSPTHRTEYLKFSPSGKVPCLNDNCTVVWDSLAIAEYLAERAQARVTPSAGHMPGCRSARYSAIESESQTIVLPSRKHGTLPEGEWTRIRSGESGS